MPISAGLILAVVITGTDRVLIAAFMDEASAGAYHAGYGLAHRTLDIIFIWLGLAGVPTTIAALERGGRPALEVAARQQAELMILLTLPAAVGLALVAGPLAELMVGEALRRPAAQVIPWIAAGAWFFGFRTYYLDQAFTLAKRPSLMLVATLIPALLNLGLNLVLIPRMGLLGAMVATTASLIAGAFASYVLGGRVLPLPLPWGTFARCGLAVAGMGVAVLLTPHPGGALELGLKAAVGAVVYGILVYLLDGAGARSRLAAMRLARRNRQPQADLA
jgi:O-antigen/teichoic acid export membrane protein